MHNKIVKEFEIKVLKKLIRTFLLSGFKISFQDEYGEEEQTKPLKSIKSLFIQLDDFYENNSVFYIFPSKPGKSGWIKIITLNGGALICDYTVNLENNLQEINKYLNKYL